MISRPAYGACSPCISVTNMQGSQTEDNAAMPVDGVYPLKDTSVWSATGGSLRFSIEDEATWVAGIRCVCMRVCNCV